MPFGVLGGFNLEARLTTTAATTINSVPCYVTARLVAGAAAAKLRIFNGSTAAAAQVGILAAAAQGADETSIPIRCQDGVRVLMSVNTSTAFIYIA